MTTYNALLIPLRLFVFIPKPKTAPTGSELLALAFGLLFSYLLWYAAYHLFYKYTQISSDKRLWYIVITGIGGLIYATAAIALQVYSFYHLITVSFIWSLPYVLTAAAFILLSLLPFFFIVYTLYLNLDEEEDFHAGIFERGIYIAYGALALTLIMAPFALMPEHVSKAFGTVFRFFGDIIKWALISAVCIVAVCLFMYVSYRIIRAIKNRSIRDELTTIGVILLYPAISILILAAVLLIYYLSGKYVPKEALDTIESVFGSAAEIFVPLVFCLIPLIILVAIISALFSKRKKEKAKQHRLADSDPSKSSQTNHHIPTPTDEDAPPAWSDGDKYL